MFAVAAVVQVPSDATVADAEVTVVQDGKVFVVHTDTVTVLAEVPFVPENFILMLPPLSTAPVMVSAGALVGTPVDAALVVSQLEPTTVLTS
jgi:hypothetical protein